MYSFRENKKTWFGITALLMLFITIVCLSVRLNRINEALSVFAMTGPVYVRDWAIVAITFCSVSFVMITTSLISIKTNGELGNSKANWLFYGGLVVGIIASSITLGSAHDSYKMYELISDASLVVPTAAANLGVPFIPMVISASIQGLILIVATIVDIQDNSTSSVDMVAIGESRNNKKLSQRSYLGNLNETISSFKDYAPVNKPKTKAKPKAAAKTVAKAKVTKSYTEAEFQAKLNRELKSKKADTFDDMVKRVGKAEKLLKSGDMSQKDFDTYKAKQLEKFK